MRVALADDSALFRRGLAALLSTAGVEVVVEARDGQELLDRLAALPRRPDVVILDIRMPPTFTHEGLDAAEQVRRRFGPVGVLVLSTYAQADYAARLLSGVADGVGYLLKDRVDDLQTLTDALVRVSRGESVVDPDLISRLLMRQRRSQALESLSAREQEVLRLMAEGRSNAGISSHLFLSAKTVEAHVASVFTKLGLHAETNDNRRVLAVLSWLRATSGVA